MSESVDQILKDSVSQKRSYLKYLIPAVFLAGGVGFYFWYTGSADEEVVYTPEIYEVVQGSISSTVSSDGNIINPDIVNLSFLINGTLEALNVKEGDKVEAGEVLAELDKRDLNFDLQSAQNSVNIAWQNIKARQADITDTDIINAVNDLEVTESQIETSKASAEQNLEIAKKSAEARKVSAQQSLDQAFADAKINIESAFPTLDKALEEVDYVFGIDRNYNGKTIAYQAFNDSIGQNEVKRLYQDLTQQLDTLRDDYQSRKLSMEQAQVSQIVWKTQTLAQQIGSMFDTVVSVFATSHDSVSVSQNTINSSLATMQSLQSQVQNTESNLSNTKQSIDTAFLNLQNTFTDITNDLSASELNLQNTLSDLENNLKNAELKVSNAEKTVNKSNISKQTSLNIQYAQLEQSKLQVEKALYNVGLATLTAPKAGTIIRINGSVGESLKADSIDADNAFIRIVSDANFTTEVYVEEIDIAQIETGQKTQITLDAIPDATLEGTVSYISSIAEIDNNGIVTYLVQIDITDTKDAPIREGMTTYVDFVLGEANDVLIIPNSAIVRGRSVLLENGERKTIEAGFTDGEFTEVKSGLELGDKIISNPQVEGAAGGAQRGEGGRGGGGAVTPERLEQMKAAGFTDEELTKLQAGEITDDMRAKMQKMREAAGDGGNVLGGATRGGGGGGGRPR